MYYRNLNLRDRRHSGCRVRFGDAVKKIRADMCVRPVMKDPGQRRGTGIFRSRKQDEGRFERCRYLSLFLRKGIESIHHSEEGVRSSRLPCI